jgi:DNA-binding response OmpR family regulator
MSLDPELNSAPDGAEAAGRPQVLLVEDHADMRAYLRKHLARDYDVLEAARGDEGLRLARKELPDVVVADIMMPGLDGYALCRALKQDPETDFLPVILLTARTGLSSKLEGLEGGADDYLTKPFEPAELLLRIRNLMRARVRLRAHFHNLAAGESVTRPPLPDESPDVALRRRLVSVLEAESANLDFDLVALAQGVGMSRAQMHRRVAELFQTTPAELLMRYRLDQAARLLSQGVGNVSEVAFAVGFKNVSHFVRRFRAQHGQTPADHAAQARVKTSPPSAA